MWSETNEKTVPQNIMTIIIIIVITFILYKETGFSKPYL